MNWSQAITAQKLQMTIPVYSNLGNGKTDISITRLYTVAGLFEVSILDLIYERGENPFMLLTEEVRQLKETVCRKNDQIYALQLRVITTFEKNTLL